MRLNDESIEEIRARRPKINFNDFVRTAVKEKLERERQAPDAQEIPET